MATSLQQMIMAIGRRYHPLFHLRKYRGYHTISRWLDIPVKVHLADIPYPVFASLSKNLSFVLSGGHWGEAKERVHFTALLQCGDFHRFVDIGANIGIYGFTFHSLAGSCDVFLIEPDHKNFELLQRTIRAASLQRITALRTAISDSTGDREFLVDDITGATGSIAHKIDDAFIHRHHRRRPHKVVVPCTSLDCLFSSSDEDPDILKIDAEGAEMDIFTGGQRLFTRSRPAMILECDSNQADVSRLLLEMGYILFNFETMQETLSLCHNSLALHEEKHKSVIDVIRQGRFLDMSSAA
jgi:FkbM family methyltransferase